MVASYSSSLRWRVVYLPVQGLSIDWWKPHWLSFLLRTELSHPCISSSYTPGYCSITLHINNTSCAVNDKRRSMSSTAMACSFIYADLCVSFFTYRPFVLLFPSGLGNQPWRYFCIFFRIFFTNVNPTFRSLAIAIALNPCTSKNTSRQRKLEE